MKVLLILMALLVFSNSSFSATAVWTGRSEMVQTVTYKWVWRCEYTYAGRNFWFLFESSCPSSVQVQ